MSATVATLARGAWSAVAVATMTGSCAVISNYQERGRR